MNIKEAIGKEVELTGSTWIPFEKIPKDCIAGLDDLIHQEKIAYIRKNDTDYFTTKELFRMEAELAEDIVRIRDSGSERKINGKSIDISLSKFEKDGCRLAEEQEEAVRKAAENNFCIITGGPGTGKTTVLKALDYTLRDAGMKNIQYAAPTGKAARRISESVGKKAVTVHSLIHLKKDGDKSSALSEAEAVIVDEVSMLDLPTCSRFMKAVKDGTKIVFIGDIDQLPSVGYGAVLRDLIKSGVVPVERLIKTFRQGAGSLIIDNMKNIRDGIFYVKNGVDFKIMTPTERYTAEQEIIAVYLSEYKRLGGCEKLVILTPFRKREYNTSSEALNDKIQEIVNPGKGLRIGNIEYRVGDPVMQLVNRDECVNGDVGKVISVCNKSITVSFTDCSVVYTEDDLATGQLTLAYAMSIHKSQGSEYESVIVVLLNEHGPMLQRNLLYTAVTRAKKKCFLVCEEDAVKKAVSTDAGSERVTMLSEMLAVIDRNIKGS